MPCFDSRNSEEQEQAAVMYKKMEAMLCGITEAFSKEEILTKVNWADVGVDKEFFVDWLLNHQIKDMTKGINERELTFYGMVIASPIDTGVDGEVLKKLSFELESRKNRLGIYGELDPMFRVNTLLKTNRQEAIKQLLYVEIDKVAIRVSNITYSSAQGEVYGDVTILNTPLGKALGKSCTGDGTQKPNFKVKPRIVNIGGKNFIVTFDAYPK